MRYKDYGEKGVFVNQRWRDLNNFIEDIDKIEGFSVEGLLQGKIHLDKDIKDRYNKEYCLDKVVFVSIELNNQYKPNQQKPFVAISPEGEIYEAYNQSEFARLHNLSQKGISFCLRGKQARHKGWKFTYRN